MGRELSDWCPMDIVTLPFFLLDLYRSDVDPNTFQNNVCRVEDNSLGENSQFIKNHIIAMR